METLYCQMFIRTNIPQSALMDLIQQELGGQHDWHILTTSIMELSLVKNDDYSPERSSAADLDAFLFYRCYCDVDPAPDVPRDSYIDAIGALARFLTSQQMKVVVASDFEEELPVEAQNRPQD